MGWPTAGHAAVGNCGRLIRGRAKNSHASATAPQSDRSPQRCGDICMDTEQTDTALPVDKMVISSHLTVTKHFLLHSSMLLSNEVSGCSVVSRQAPHLAGASLGAGAPASHPPLQGAVQWLTVAELTCVCPKTPLAPGSGTTPTDIVNAAGHAISPGTSFLSLCLPCG